MGLFIAGVGTSFVLYSTLLNNVDGTVTQLVQSEDVATRLLEVSQNEDGAVEVRQNDDNLDTSYFVGLYGPDGEFIGSAGGLSDDGEEPLFAEDFTPDEAKTLESRVFAIESSAGGRFRASAAVVELEGTNSLYSQIVAIPESETLSVVRLYFVVFTFVAIMTVVAGAFLTRWLVTLTFRRFGQVEDTAMAIAGGDYGQRLPDTEPRTEIGRLSIAINTMLDRLDRSIEQRDATVRQMRRFIGDASHELRTPLVSVRGYAELYRMGAIKPEDMGRTMERIEKEAIRMGALVEDLLALARLDEKRALEIAPIDLRKIAGDAAMDARAADSARKVTVVDRTLHAFTGSFARQESPPTPDAAERGKRRGPSAIERATTSAISILRRRPKTSAPSDEELNGETRPVPRITIGDPEFTDYSGLPPLVLGEEHKVRQVVANLLGNARRYSPDGTPIELEVGIDAVADMGWIAVVDHGDGIPESIRGQIFQRFWRADTSRARETGGSGLGLSIVSSIVEAHHGTVAVTETPGGGATFRVSFPLVERRTMAEHAAIETQPLPRLREE